jgi:DNA-binding LacI/PurR family transcriptional regulator
VDAARIGDLTAEIIVKRLQGEETTAQIIDVGFDIVIRQSS